MSASIPVYNPQSLPDWNEAVEQWVIYLAAWGRRPSTLIHYGDELRRFAAWAGEGPHPAKCLPGPH
ncbi:MAG TPA: hypothetical protein VLB67_04680 [Acidimicrobiia bacterium]|nr:hypothetical protein [Acidimicrobiia bacterium]